jgi:endonuclease III related protein
LLSLNGVGPETADSILLYAGNHPSFVVDGYTRRILERHGLATPKTTYGDIRELFHTSLGEPSFMNRCRADAGEFTSGRKTRRNKPQGSCHTPSRASTMKRPELAQVFNEMHGLIVGVGKNYCLKSVPNCEACPLGKLLPKPVKKAFRERTSLRV